MKTIRLISGCVLTVFSLAAAAQTSTSNSGSGSTSISGATSTSQGNGSSVNNIGLDASTRSGATSGSSATAVSGQGGRGGNALALGGFSGGNSLTTNVNILSGAADTSGSSGQSNKAAAGTQSDPITSKSQVEYQGSYSVKNTPSIAGPALTTTLSDTCMGSVSFGLSITGFGATGGSTIVDQACVRRLDAREFRAMGLNDVALALLCESASNRAAVEATGHLCPGTTAPLKKKASETAAVSDADYHDPIVRARLGLEPLHEDTLSAR